MATCNALGAKCNDDSTPWGCLPSDVDDSSQRSRQTLREKFGAVTVSGGRSGVCGAAVPLFAGVVIDTTDLNGVVSVDQLSGLIEVLPGTLVQT